MKVRFSITVEVDTDAWMTEYGIESRDVREDVKTYLEDVATNSNPHITRPQS